MATRRVSVSHRRRLVVTGGIALLSGFVPAASGRASPTVDPVVIVVSVTSPVITLSRREVSDLYLGVTQRFPNGTAAVVVDLSARSPDHTVFYARFVGLSDAQVRAHWSKLIFTGRGRPPREVATGEALRELIANDPRVLGYLSAHLVDARLRVVQVP